MSDIVRLSEHRKVVKEIISGERKRNRVHLEKMNPGDYV
jgi:hypothetical protein